MYAAASRVTSVARPEFARRLLFLGHQGLFSPVNSRQSWRPVSSLQSEAAAASKDGIRLVLSVPRGFCGGVVRAINTVEEALRIWGPPIYVKHEIVHNRIVCERLKEKGAIFIEDVNDVPEGAKVVYSAHGIPPETRVKAAGRELLEVDATCPLVTKLHVYVKKMAAQNYKIVLVGHKDHVEVLGTYGEAPEATTIVESVDDVNALNYAPDEKLFYVTQTTMSIDDCAEVTDALKAKYPHIESIPSGSICFATTNRQGALKAAVWKENFDLALVVGDPMSSNSLRLAESARNRGVPAHLVQGPDQITADMLKGVKSIVMTSGASTPQDVLQMCVEKLQQMGVTDVEEFEFAKENVTWRLPKNLEAAIKKHDAQVSVQA